MSNICNLFSKVTHCVYLTVVSYILHQAQPGEMYIGHVRLCVCLCLYVCLALAAFLYYCTYPEVTLQEWQTVPSSSALLDGFAIGARVLLLWQHTRLMRNVSEDACTRCMAGHCCARQRKTSDHCDVMFSSETERELYNLEFTKCNNDLHAVGWSQVYFLMRSLMDLVRPLRRRLIIHQPDG